MRDIWCRSLVTLGVLLLSALPPQPSRAQSSVPAVQSLFLGDRTCLDDARDCRFSGVLARHRYLHVIVHDLAGNDDWGVQASPFCSDTMPDISGGLPIGANGFLEVVSDLQAMPGAPGVTAGRCFVFRGRNHWAVTFYAAYFDAAAAPDADQVYPGFEALAGRPDLPDLDVTYIHRDPAYPYDAPKNAPAPGDPVTFTAHVMNAGWRPASPFSYHWYVGRSLVESGTSSQPLNPGQETVFSLRWRWQLHPQKLKFQLVPEGDDLASANNQLSIRTDALALGYWVERSAYAYFRDQQWLYCQNLRCSGSNSFEDWLQRQVAAWNQLLASSSDPEVAPTGVADRVRVDKVIVVPDGTLPLHGGRATNSPNAQDHSVDLQWGLPAQDAAKTYPHNWEGPFDVDWALIEELSHARYLADLYRFDIPLRDASQLSAIGMDGKPVWNAARPLDAANKILPFTAGRDESFFYQNREQDLMSCVCTPSYSPYTIAVLNRLRGRRPRCGNANPPCNLGEWFADIPPVNRMRVLDRQGRPVPDTAQVRLFFDTDSSLTGHAFDNTHSTLLSPSGSMVQLPADPFATHGSIPLAGHNLLLIEVHTGAEDEFCFQEPTSFNMAYWLGYRETAHPATYVLRLGEEGDNG